MKYEVGDKIVSKSNKQYTIIGKTKNNYYASKFGDSYAINDNDIDHEKTKELNRNLEEFEINEKQKKELKGVSSNGKLATNDKKTGGNISAKQAEKRRIFKEITDNMLQLYKDKNEDYRDSFARTKKEYSHAIVIRLMDKLWRLQSLYEGEVNIKDEGIDNVLIDMANYCVMEMVEREVENATKDVRPKC
jgi:hypothetical protein